MRKLFVCTAMAVLVLAWLGVSMADLSTKTVMPSRLAGSNPGPPGALVDHGRRPAILQVFEVVDSVPAPGASARMGLAWGGGYLWLASNEQTPILIYKIDTSTGQAVDTLVTSINDYILGLTYLNGSLWLQEWWLQGATYQIDPVSGATISSFISPAGTGSRGLTNDGTYLWIAGTGGGVNMGTVYQVDTLGATQRSVSISSVINWPMGMTYNQRSGYMWVNDNDIMNDVNELDVSGGSATLISEHTPPGNPSSEIPEGLTNDDFHLWYTAYYASWIWKINIAPLLDHDVSVFSIDSPGRIVEEGVPVTPGATILNEGQMTAIGFQVVCRIDSAGSPVYFDSIAVDSVLSDSTIQVILSSTWTPGPPLNDYDVTFYTNYASDSARSNDTLRSIASSFGLMPILYSPPGVTPTFDGLIEPGEWADANVYDISDVFQKKGEINFPGSAILHVMNDVNQIYFAIDAQFDESRTEFDRIGIAFDDNRDDAYPVPGDDSEGLLTLYYTSLLDFVSYTSLHSDGSQGSPYGVNFEAGTALPAGHEQYELAVPFGSLDERLDASPLDTVGLHIFVADSSVDGGEYGGWWFQSVEANQWDEPAYYGDLVLSDGVGVTEALPQRRRIANYRLGQNFPNPFSDLTAFEYAVPDFASDAHATVRIYDAAGRVVRTLLDNDQAPGNYKLLWTGTDDSGAKVAGGTYFLRFKSGSFTATKRLVLIR